MIRRWKQKAILQKVISALPRSEQVNYLFQSKVTKNLPVSDEAFVEKIRIAGEQFKRLEALGLGDTVRCFEFGAGFDLSGPLGFWALGVEHQTIVDIRPNVHWDLVSDGLAKLKKNQEAISRITGRRIRLPKVSMIENAKQLADNYGIRYLAPSDARATGLSAGSFDFVSSNSTLEHIPRKDILLILRETSRLLTSEGIQSHFIDLKDHSSYFDPSITKYNFLQFTDAQWSLYNSDLSYQNRLRAPEYLGLFSEAGSSVIQTDNDEADHQDLAELATVKLSPQFESYSPRELALKIMRVTLRPRA